MKAPAAHIRRATDWLQARGPSERALVGDSGQGVSRAVVIPVLAESNHLLETLGSLARNPVRELQDTLVICVVNNRAEPYARADQIVDNQRALEMLDQHVQSRGLFDDGAGLRLAYIDAASPGNELTPKMGVGEARRIGLDCALAILCKNKLPDGLLISLDGDSPVEYNYLEEIRRHFESCDAGAAVVAYAHPMPSDRENRQGILLYELFLRYHELGLRAAGSPYALPTVGSTIVVKGEAYIAAGGMNKKQAGEDFYFLQQLVKTGSVSRIDTTTVFPSPRESDRVPFGTGASIGRHLTGDEGLQTVYHPECYRVLGAWLALAQRRLEFPALELLEWADQIAPQLGEFLRLQKFESVWPRLQENAPDLAGLMAQIHRWFDGFKSLKLIHYLRDNGYPPMPIEEAIRILAGSFAKEGTCDFHPDHMADLLDQLRGGCRDWPAAESSWNERGIR